MIAQLKPQSVPCSGRRRRSVLVAAVVALPSQRDRRALTRSSRPPRMSTRLGSRLILPIVGLLVIIGPRESVVGAGFDQGCPAEARLRGQRPGQRGRADQFSQGAGRRRRRGGRTGQPGRHRATGESRSRAAGHHERRTRGGCTKCARGRGAGAHRRGAGAGRRAPRRGLHGSHRRGRDGDPPCPFAHRGTAEGRAPRRGVHRSSSIDLVAPRAPGRSRHRPSRCQRGRRAGAALSRSSSPPSSTRCKGDSPISNG